MDDQTPTFESPVTTSYPATPGAPLELADVSSLAKLVVRADLDTGAAAQMAVPFGTSRMQGDVLVAGQRPTEWTLIGNASSVAALAESIDRAGHVSTIDHTHSRAMFNLTGAESCRLLEKVCGLDWDDAMTPDGAVMSASVAKVNCDIIRQDRRNSRSYLLACDRSFAQYLFDALLDAGSEFGIGVSVA